MRRSFSHYQSSGSILASHIITIAHGLGGPYIRGPSLTSGEDWKCTIGYAGVGKPGANQNQHGLNNGFHRSWSLAQNVPPPNSRRRQPLFMVQAVRGICRFSRCRNKLFRKPMLQDAIQDGHFEQYGSSDQMSPVEDQFKKVRISNSRLFRDSYGLE